MPLLTFYILVFKPAQQLLMIGCLYYFVMVAQCYSHLIVLKTKLFF